jgi:hypothetical protein
LTEQERKLFVMFRRSPGGEKELAVYRLDAQGHPAALIWSGVYETMTGRMIKQDQQATPEEIFLAQLEAYRLEYAPAPDNLDPQYSDAMALTRTALEASQAQTVIEPRLRLFQDAVQSDGPKNDPFAAYVFETVYNFVAQERLEEAIRLLAILADRLDWPQAISPEMVTDLSRAILQSHEQPFLR